MKILFLPIVATFVLGCGANVKEPVASAPEKIEINKYVVKHSIDENIPFSGYVNFDDFNARYAVNGAYYSGYDAVSFLATVLAHAAISKSADHRKMQNFIQECDDNALAAYSEIVGGFSEEVIFDDLESNTTGDMNVPLVLELKAQESPRGYVHIDPMYILTKSNDSLILKNKIVVNESDPEAVVEAKNSRRKSRKSIEVEPLYENTIVILTETGYSDQSELILDQGEQLKNLVKELFAESIQMFDEDFGEVSSSNAKMETIKYHIGEHFRVERGRVIERTCDRVVFATLRGEIKSVPQASDCNISKL